MKKLINISPLAFYTSLAQQNHRKSYAYGQIYPLLIQRNMLLPFQFVLLSTTESLGCVLLHSYDKDFTADITDNMKNAGLEIKAFEGYSLIKYPSLFPILKLDFEGPYYLEIITSENKYYSDIFFSSNNIENCVTLEYANSYNLIIGKNGEATDFSGGFKFKCYLQSQIGKPEYAFEEEVTERLGRSYIESQVSKKIYKFVFAAPEYLCDALRLVRLCDYKQIGDKFTKYEADTFAIAPKWEEQGDIAAVEAEFEEGTIIANIGGYEPEKLKGKGSFDSSYDYSFKRTGREFRYVKYSWTQNNNGSLTFMFSMKEPVEEELQSFTFKTTRKVAPNGADFTFPFPRRTYKIGAALEYAYTYSAATLNSLAIANGFSSADALITDIMSDRLSTSMEDSKEKMYSYAAIPVENIID